MNEKRKPRTKQNQTANEAASSSLVADILWVHSNLDNEFVTADVAPSPGAFTLLQQARADSKWFFEKMLPKALPNKKEQEIAAHDLHDHERQMALIARAEKVIAEAADVYGG